MDDGGDDDDGGGDEDYTSTCSLTDTLILGPQMFVEVWLHHYSLGMYQKLQSPQVKVR